ncbi:MAG: CcmD family protein [Longimicrobiales bacterium]|nr:CcmD family protein [Longimicrobiales bacterium]
MTLHSIRRILSVAGPLLGLGVLVFATPEGVAAQTPDLGQQTLGRAYWHVFIAYTIGWALILGWIVSIARRVGALERRIEREE